MSAQVVAKSQPSCRDCLVCRRRPSLGNLNPKLRGCVQQRGERANERRNGKYHTGDVAHNEFSRAI